MDALTQWLNPANLETVGTVRYQYYKHSKYQGQRKNLTHQHWLKTCDVGAVESECKYIVTHNLRDFSGADKFGIKAITPQKLLRMIGEIS